MTIGFNPTEYTVAENEGSVQLTVAVLAGQLQRDVSVQFSTSPATAECKHILGEIKGLFSAVEHAVLNCNNIITFTDYGSRPP